MGTGTEARQNMREEIEVENEGIAIAAELRWLAIPQSRPHMTRGRVTAIVYCRLVTSRTSLAKILRIYSYT